MSAHARTPETLATVRRLWVEGHSASMIAEAMGANATKASIEHRLRNLGLTARHRRQGAALVYRTTAGKAQQAEREAARVAARDAKREAFERRRVVIWNMAAEGLSTVKIAQRVGVMAETVTRSLALGKPVATHWHAVNAGDFPPSLLAKVARAGIDTVAMMNTAAKRWGIPATAIFGRGEQSALRTPAVAAARAEVATRLRRAGLTLPVCAAVLQVHNTAIMAALTRFQDERRPEFSALRAELAGGAQ